MAYINPYRTLLYLFLAIGLFISNCDYSKQPPDDSKNIDKEESQKRQSLSQRFNPPKFAINVGVDTTRPKIKSIVKLWHDYLNSNPEKLNQNPYWSEQEQEKYNRFDLTSKRIYVNHHWQKIFYPLVLSVNKNDAGYKIRTMFYQYAQFSRSREAGKRFAVHAIISVYAKKVNDKWKLFNALPIRTSDWGKKEYEYITYHYPKSYDFNNQKAQKSVKFIDSVATLFNLSPSKKIQFYITSNLDKMFSILGFDYTAVEAIKRKSDSLGGTSYPKNNMVITVTNSERHDHELIHVLFSDYKLHSLINEGLATWLGGHYGKKLDWHIKRLQAYLSSNKELDLSKLRDIRSIDMKGSNGTYIIGAILCREAYKKGGIKAVKKLMTSGPEYKELLKGIEEILGIQKDKLNSYLINKVNKYSRK